MRLAAVLIATISSMLRIIGETGGIQPAERKRSRHALTLAEREEVSRGLVVGLSMRRIAKTLGRSTSTISREISRNGGRRRYRAARADKRAWKEALRPKPCKLVQHGRLRHAVIVAQALLVAATDRGLAETRAHR